MNKFLEKIYPFLPGYMHNLFVTGFNLFAYHTRYSRNYRKYRKQFKDNENLSLKELNHIQFNKLMDLLKYSIKHSTFYNEIYKEINIESFTSIEDLHQLPIIDKQILRSNFSDIITISKSDANISKTGGTTGLALEIFEHKDDTRYGYGMLDNFRRKHGYELGKKTAWFSGKNLLTEKDVRNHIFWKTDWWYKVRYYSTFHIQDKYLEYYVKDLIKFRPEYLVGFPSTMNEIATFGLDRKIEFQEGIVKAIFPTAETFTNEMRNNIEAFFKTRAYNQYASSEGAPFIFECNEGNLHMELQSGVFEVLDDKNLPTQVGRLIVTSFTSYGTPLIRYEIGDEIKISDRICKCGNNNPLADEIYGRINDYIFSNETGKINLGNISNCLKGVHGITKFQVLQENADDILIKVVIDNNLYSSKDENIFIQNFRDRVGLHMGINLQYVNNISNVKSGKYRLVINNFNR
ncbi:MAG TPA: polysaccharide biosynthesis protein [Prolixibacteraceae bacterium]|nr:polysaccharide biosynthesis protein [Prolixibacteraceae bacterium]